MEDGRLAEILTAVPDEDGVDLENAYVIPGLVDVHTHGNSGADFSDGDYAGLVRMARFYLQNGITSFASASMTLPYEGLETAFRSAVRLKNEAPEGCARLMGIQMEGLFFSEKRNPPVKPNLIKISSSPDRQLDGLGCFANIKKVRKST